MEGQSSAEFSQYSYQSEQWSRLLRRNSPAQSTLSNTPGFVAPPHLPTHFDLVPILLPQQSTYHRAQLLQYNKLIASTRSAHLQALPLPPLLSAEHIQAVPRQRSTSTNVNTDRNAKVSSRGGHGNREARKLSKGERALIAEKDEIATMPSKKFDLPNPLPARPLAQHQNSSLSMQSNSVPSTPHQHARKFSFESREPSPNAATSHSPRSAYSESDSKLNILKPLPPRDFRKGGCIYETAQAKSRRRMPYSIGEAKLEKLDPSKIKSKLTKDEERKLTTDMRELYDRLLPTPDKELRRQKLVQKLEKLLNEEWPGNDIKVLMYGSSGNLLCTDESDVDLCITTSWKGLDTCMISDLLARNGMEQVVCISTAKVPIVKIWDPELSLACDMNINETVAIENTRMIKTYVQIDDRVRPLAMVIKHWTKERALNDAGSLFVLSSYTWMCLIINFLQTREPPIVPALHQRQHLKLPPKEGQGESSFADDVEALKKLGEKNTETLGELLFHFFRFYGHEFDYDNLVVSVRNGKQIPKKEKGPNFLGANPWALCVEEPFNVTRNLGNTADGFSFRGLHMELRRAFDLISDAKLGECCEKFEWPPEEKPFWEKRAPQPKPILSRSASQSNRGGRNGHHRGGRNNHGRNNNGNRRASSGAFDSNGVYLPQGVPSNMTPENAWFQQQQAQAQLHNELFTKYTVLQAEEIRLRQYQAFQQQQAAHQAQVYSQAQSRKTANGSATKQQPSDRNRTTSFDQPPLTAPIRPDMYFYPLQFHQTPVYAYSGSSTNPPSPSMSSALPELRRSVHRSSVTNGSGPNSAQSSSSLRSHSQPATRTVQGVPMPDNGLGMYQAMHYANTQPIPNFMADENLDPAYEALSKRPMNRAPDDSIPKEYVGYYVNNSTASTPRRQPQASLAIPAFGDVGQRRRLSTDQFPQSILDRLKRTSRSPSPLGDGRRDRSCSVDAPLVPGSTTPTQHNVSSTNLKALNNQGPVVVNGSHFPMPTVASTWQATKSDRSVSEDHSSDVAVGSYSSISHGSDFGSEISADPIFSGSSTPKNTHESDRVQQPMVVNGSSPIRGNDPVRTTHAMAPPTGATSYHDSKPANPANELVPTEKLNGALRLSPNAQRTSRPQNGGMSPLDIGFAHNDTAPHLSPVYETRTPSPTANRKFEPGMERIVNGANCNAKDAKAEKLNPISKFAPVNGSQLKSSSADAKSNGHTRASKSEGSGPHSWQKASKQKKKGQASDPKTASNGHPLGERLPHNESERKGG